MIDEASKFHVVKVVRENTGQLGESLGNINVTELLQALKDNWFRYFQSPMKIHCDSEGVFNSQQFLSWCGQKGIRVATTAGEAHWQLGIVERHIATLQDTAQKLSLDRPSGTPIQDIVDDACEAKNSVGRYSGYSPCQWQLGRKHPLSQSHDVPPCYKEDEFLQHVHRRKSAQQAFLEAEARTIVRLASLARARSVFEVKAGDIVYYYRRGRKQGRKNLGRFLGPAKVLAVETPESRGNSAPTIVWLGHGLEMIRAAPEHLRRATPLEVTLSDFVNESRLPRTSKGLEPKYRDLGAPPDQQELQDADDDIGNDDDGDDQQPPKKRQRLKGQAPPQAAKVDKLDSDSDDYEPHPMNVEHSSMPPLVPQDDADSGKYHRRAASQDYGSSRSRTPMSQMRWTPPSVSPESSPTAMKPPDDTVTPMNLDPFDVEAPATPERRPTGGQSTPLQVPPPATPPVAVPSTPPELPQPGDPEFDRDLFSSSYLHDSCNSTLLNHLISVHSKYDNANIGYSYFLSSQAKKARSKHHVPQFVFHRESVLPEAVKKSQWKSKVFTYSLDIDEDDLNYFNDEHNTDSQIQDYFAFISSEAKRHAEVVIRNLSKEEKAEFDKAKRKELDQWVSNSVFSICKRAGVPTDRIMAMRWVLTWKAADDEAKSRKAKARLVVKGFTDPDLTTIRAESPTLSRLGRHFLFQVAASNKWQLQKGDVKTAFLQGSKTEDSRDIYVDPSAEIKKLLNIKDSQLMKLQSAVYGLRNAPRQWYLRLKADLLKLGCRMHSLDNCLFMLYDKGELIGIVGCYVDDCLMAGDSRNKKWTSFLKSFYESYTWSPWEQTPFMFTGTKVEQLPDYSIRLSQEDYAKSLRQSPISRGTDESRALNKDEIKDLRGIDGSLQWLVTNSRLDLAAPTSISQGHHSQGQVRHLAEANKLIRTAHATADTPLYIQSIPLDRIALVTFHDAGQGSRPDGSSQGGFIIIAADKAILDGKEQPVTILDYRSFRLKRVARSSLSAEVQAFAEALDATEFSKLFLAETLSPVGLDLRKADDQIKSICPNCLVTDCKSLYDAVVKSTSCGLNLSEKRTSIEVLACRERMQTLEIPLKWVNSDRQIADGLTKITASWKLQKFQQNPTVRLIYDPEFVAAKKIKAVNRQDVDSRLQSDAPTTTKIRPRTTVKSKAKAKPTRPPPKTNATTAPSTRDQTALLAREVNRLSLELAEIKGHTVNSVFDPFFDS